MITVGSTSTTAVTFKGEVSLLKRRDSVVDDGASLMLTGTMELSSVCHRHVKTLMIYSLVLFNNLLPVTSAPSLYLSLPGLMGQKDFLADQH